VGSKPRPVIVLFDTGDADVVVVPATTRGGRGQYDVEIREWKQAGFHKPCWIKVNKPQTIEKQLMSNKSGVLSQDDWAMVRTAFTSLMALVR